MNYLECETNAMKCLASCFSYAIVSLGKGEGIDINDIESLREVLRILRPDSKVYDYGDAVIQMAKGDFVSTINTLRELIAAIPNYPGAKTTLAMALFHQKEPTWKSLANDIIDDSHSSKHDIEAIHIIFQNDWMNQGKWDAEKEESLKQYRALRFSSNTDIKNNNQEAKNSMDTMQPYTIRM